MFLSRKTLGRTRNTLSGIAFLMLAGCGGGHDGSTTSSTAAGGVDLQVVSFGDSLSDVGTYAGTGSAGFVRGRYTTNPGEVWTQKVAEYYGGTLTAAYLGGYGTPLVASTGLGYAQGGSRVTDPIGESHATTSATDYSAATTVPIVTQVQEYLSAHGTFNANQLVLINGGANDIFIQATTLVEAVAADVAAGMTLQAAITQETQTTLVPVATALAAQVAAVLAAGATHVVVSNVPDIGQTPLALALGTQGQAILTAVAQAYNTALYAALQSAGNLSKVVYVDAFTWQDNLSTNYVANGFTVSNTATACNLTAMAAVAVAAGLSDPTSYASSLYCTSAYLTAAGADQTYLFADDVHPTTHTHALFAAYVEQQIAASGLGK
ncbi:SGNH/GDSL hydrolase family protein [Robbsia sp. Bb-Pol-6]|uniref:SGNH/GDSL hydrolase family protein n=1 Tax=Robbsia betulipollinis TaxID=2981849 RepID=A0ABT3ZNM3_9BURK|nr:SGNH/GDSL hydrolase family protein [Robbsia betulipollinis]MCY0388146.1 SGNH/GDSL hydrolase family protein [Robbsia betulipollinis]